MGYQPRRPWKAIVLNQLMQIMYAHVLVAIVVREKKFLEIPIAQGNDLKKLLILRWTLGCARADLLRVAHYANPPVGAFVMSDMNVTCCLGLKS